MGRRKQRSHVGRAEPILFNPMESCFYLSEILICQDSSSSQSPSVSLSIYSLPVLADRTHSHAAEASKAASYRGRPDPSAAANDVAAASCIPICCSAAGAIRLTWAVVCWCYNALDCFGWRYERMLLVSGGLVLEGIAGMTLKGFCWNYNLPHPDIDLFLQT